MSITVAIVEDDAGIRDALIRILGRSRDFHCLGCYPSAEDALRELPTVKPDVVLMDEPCSALDPVATQRIEELMFELKKHYTILIVTHNMQQAARVSERTGFMLLGKLVEYGETKQIFTNPAEKQTEEYITGRYG